MTTETAAGVQGLTELQIKKMRTSDYLYFTFNREKGISHLDAVKDESKDSPWKQSITIPVETITQSYDYGTRVASARCSITNWGHTVTPLTTFLDSLKVGDVVVAEVQADAGNNYMKDAGLHYDVLRLCIKRKSTRINKLLVFEVEHTMSPDNSARMCRMEKGW